MVEHLNVFGIMIPRLLLGLTVVLAYLILAFVLRRILFSQISRVAAKSATQLDDIISGALRGPLTLVILIVAAWVAERFMGLPVDWNEALDTITRGGVILASMLFADRFVRKVIDQYHERMGALSRTSSFIKVVARIVILLLGGLILLDMLHVSITPVLASLGVGGLAIGLALQGTLSNLFAGIQIIGDRPVREGDFIKLQSGEEGYVTEIGWRATKIRMLPNNVVIIPNSKLADSIMTNYYLPTLELAVLVEVGVSYNSDLEQVERVTIEVAQEIQKTVPGAIPEFKPFIRYHTFDSSSINFSVIMRAREFVDNYLIKHEFIKRLHARYKQEDIVIPWPIRTLDVSPALLERLAPREGKLSPKE